VIILEFNSQVDRVYGLKKNDYKFFLNRTYKILAVALGAAASRGLACLKLASEPKPRGFDSLNWG
jgi:hypothetical protein